MSRPLNDGLIGPLAQLAGLFVALGLIYPSLHQVVAGIGSLFVITLGLGVIVVLFLGTCKVLRRRTSEPCPSNPFGQVSATPTSAIQRLKTTQDIIEQLRSIDWFQFEQLVALVYRKQGYIVSRRGGANPDGGIDLVIEKPGMRIAVQCKHWKTWNVGVKAVREFLGALTDSGIQRGMFITLGGYTSVAKQLADKHRIELVNESALARMFEATNARFDPAALEILSDKRKLCPKCEKQMVLRTASKGKGIGQTFWGCSAYPRCRFTMPF